MLLKLFVVYFYLPVATGITLPAFWAGVFGLALNYAAYEAENYRAGLQAIPGGQMEAALALGMSPFTALQRIIVPQAVRLVVPPVTNDFISLFKDTSICYAIAVTELMARYRTLMTSDFPQMAVYALVLTGGLYLMMSYPLSLLARRLEHRSALTRSTVAGGRDAMIEVRNLVKRHGDLPVLRGVSLVVKPGEVAVVIGPSGGGKSTLLPLHQRSGDVSPQGEVQVERAVSSQSRADRVLTCCDVAGASTAGRHGVPAVPPVSALGRVLENVMSGPLCTPRAGKRSFEVEPEALALARPKVGLADKVGARCEQLSGGQQQPSGDRLRGFPGGQAGGRSCSMSRPALRSTRKWPARCCAVMEDLADSGPDHGRGDARHELRSPSGRHTVHVMAQGNDRGVGAPRRKCLIGRSKTATRGVPLRGAAFTMPGELDSPLEA